VTSAQSAHRPALACIEVTSVALGIRVCDEMMKKAESQVLQSGPICPGKYLIVIGGEEENVKEAYDKGLAVAGVSTVDRLYLPNAHPQLFPALQACTEVEDVVCLGVVETFAAASSILAADTACKQVPIQLIEIRLARGLGGKAYFTLTGEQADVEAAIEAATKILGQQSGLLLRTEIIPRPHPEMVRWLF